jgi:F-box protein 9
VLPLTCSLIHSQGLFIGTWFLSGATVNILNLVDASDKQAPRIFTTATTDVSSMRYSYQMMLGIRSRPLGRWNRLDIICYESVDLDSGEAVPILLKHERPFWFSKVRSYES